MENSLKGLILAAGTVITCLVITLGFYLSNEAQATASTGTSKIGKINSEFSESDKTIYDGRDVSGSEVINAITKFENDTIGISVKTNSSQSYYGYSFDATTGALKSSTGNKYSQTTDKSDANYINPYGTFSGKVVRNSNNVITGLVFVQK